MGHIWCPYDFWEKSQNFIFVALEWLLIVFRPSFDTYLENRYETGTMPSGMSNGCLVKAGDTQP